MDARTFQIIFLAIFLTLGILVRDFSVRGDQVVTAILTCLATQFLLDRRFGQNSGWKSALISGISLGLLVRSGSSWMFALAGFLSISSKFLIRWNGKHVFNPTNFGVSILLLSGANIWVSPGQWGSEWVLGFFVLCLGITVCFYANRLDVSLAFFLGFALLLYLRISYLGQNPWILPHSLASGSLVLFSFFMISDPRTTPKTPTMRILFGLAVAAIFYLLRFRFYLTNSLFYALFFLSPLVALLDSLSHEKIDDSNCNPPPLPLPP